MNGAYGRHRSSIFILGLMPVVLVPNLLDCLSNHVLRSFCDAKLRSRTSRNKKYFLDTFTLVRGTLPHRGTSTATCSSTSPATESPCTLAIKRTWYNPSLD